MREVAPLDTERLAMTDPATGGPHPDVVRVPDDALIDVMRGSTALQDAFHRIVTGTGVAPAVDAPSVRTSTDTSTVDPATDGDTAPVIDPAIDPAAVTDPAPTPSPRLPVPGGSPGSWVGSPGS